MKNVQTYIKEATIHMDNSEYVDFLKELAEWAGTEAEMVEYKEEELDNDMLNI